MVIVSTEKVDPGAGVPEYVVCEGDVFDDRPRSRAVLIAHGEQHTKSALTIDPIVFKQVAVDDHSSCVL